MKKEKMSLHRALSELKLIDSKIEKKILGLEVTSFKQKDKPIKGYKLEEEFDKEAKAKLQSIKDLIERKAKIKNALVDANTKTKFKVSEKPMTIADAITYKANIGTRKQLLERLKGDLNASKETIETGNTKVEQNVHQLLTVTFQGKELSTISDVDQDAVRKPFEEANLLHLVDPLKIETVIDNMEDEIDSFEVDIDSALSEINAITNIEI